METSVIALSETQGPAVMAFDMSGEAGGAFVMLMIAFTLGALVGRILTASPREEKADHGFMPLPFEDAKAKRIGSPVHISELTKQAPRPPAPPTPVTPMVSTTLSIIKKEEPVKEKSAPVAPPAPRPTIILPAATPRPHFQPKPPMQRPAVKSPAPAAHQNQPERPKIRFNTSWSNPNRGGAARPSSTPQV